MGLANSIIINANKKVIKNNLNIISPFNTLVIFSGQVLNFRYISVKDIKKVRKYFLFFYCTNGVPPSTRSGDLRSPPQP